MNPAPTIAIVGRPNVGKSTLFNRFLGKRHALVAEEAGTTRDRIYQKFDCNSYECLLVDTGGLQTGHHENIEADVQAQAKLAIQDADIILFVLDISQELTIEDFAAADILRKTKKPVIIIANKADNAEMISNLFNFYELGFGEPIQISAIHKHGIEELKAIVTKQIKSLKFKKKKENAKKTEHTNLCILGKPNAGKSSLVNVLLGEEKVIVSDIPGTTRDAVDIEINYKEKNYNLIDTAGLKRPGRTKVGIEKFSHLRCLTAIERSDVVVLLIDGIKGISNQDTHIAKYALEQEKGLIIAINKIDLFEKGEEEREKIVRQLRRKFSFVPWAPITFISVKNKKNTYTILEIADEIMQQRAKRIPTNEFNCFMQKISQKHLPASHHFRKPHFMYATQVDVAPPKFVIFMKNPANLHFSYPRYLENEIRKEYGFEGTAINFKFKNKDKESE